jgi:4'-phosphopantetheinyl transferase
MTTLEDGVVEIWQADLDRAERRLEDSLTPAEREREARFKVDSARERWARGRGILRELLGRYLARDPASIELSLGPKGKPEVAGERRLGFNLSHSEGTALFAFALDTAVGIDVELRGREVRDPLGAAARSLGEAELKRLQGLEPERRAAAFLRSWVRHEAALKCRGAGLGSPGQPDGLHVLDLEVEGDAIAALAVELPPRAVRLRDFEPRDADG